MILLRYSSIARAERVAEKLANARSSLLRWLRHHPGQVRIQHRRTQTELLFRDRVGEIPEGLTLQWIEILAPIGKRVRWLAIHGQCWAGERGEGKEVADELRGELWRCA